MRTPSALLLLLATFAPAQESALSEATRRSVEAAIARAQEGQRIPGLSIAIGWKGGVRYENGFGHSDLENGVPATAATRYRTASIAKPITAVAVLQLAEQGKLDLDADIRKCCPEFPEKPWPITARQLLGHLGGVRHYQKPGESAGTRTFGSLRASLDLFKDDPLVAEPGTKHHYTTYGYTLLGCAIEAASGKCYEDALHTQVFAPAKMDRTTLDHHAWIVNGRARGYARLSAAGHRRLSPALKATLSPGDVVNADLHDTSMKIPGGGLLSTAPDLARFGIALLGDRLVKRETRDLMWSRQTLKDGSETGYGLGFGVSAAGAQKTISHTGGQAGASCILTIAPDEQLVIAIMTNLQGASLGRLAGEIRKAVLSP